MSGILSYIVFPFALWLATSLFFFVLQRPLFMLYNRKNIKEPISKDNWKEILRRGWRTDEIVGAYLTALPFLAATVYALCPHFSLRAVLLALYLFIGFLASLITVADAAVYSFWQMKIDRSILGYLKSLKGAFASISYLYLIIGFSCVFILQAVYAGGLYGLTLLFEPYSAEGLWMNILVVVLFIIEIAALELIVRGLGRRPHNPSLTYFSKTLFYNHSALNPAFNFIYSLSVKVSFSNQFRFFKPEECDKIYAPLFPLQGTPQLELLNTKRPNVVLVIWESCGARFVEALGGKADVTPNVNRLSKEGVLFTNCDAGSWRTDRGIVCLLSGYLAQPTTTIIKMTQKLRNLPALPRRFKEKGYETTLLHGGDLTIFHKSDYYLTIGHDRLVSQGDFPKSMPTCKWGIHDGEMFNWLFDDIQEKHSRGANYFTTFQTLSSHETWKVPYDRLKDNEVDNAFAYVDHCFGQFVDKLKATPAWDDLLLIMVADHGCNDGEPMPRSQYVHIPLLMLGGAVKEPRRIDTLMSQTDLAATLLGQLGMPHDEFTFSRDVLADTYQVPFTFHDYPNGFLIRNAEGYTDYDNDMNTAIEGEDATRESMGKAILQKLYDDIDRR